MNILHAFLARRKMCALFFGLREIVCISQLCSMSSQILSYINIFDINRKLLAQAFTLALIQTCSRIIVYLK